MTSNGSALFIAVALLAAAESHATPINFGTAQAISFRNCIAGISACDAVLPIVQIVYGGFPGAASSSASSTLAGYGTATGSVALSGTIGAPIVAASATSSPGTRVNTTSVALQSYTYTGAVETTRTFGGTVTYSQTSTGNYPFDVGGGIFAALAIFTLPVSMIEAGTTPESNFAALVGVFDLPGYFELGVDVYSDPASTASGSGELGVTITLDPGDTIWVWALLQTPAVNGGFIDASHTFITGWDNIADLRPAVAVVPEPATLVLLAIGLAALGFSRRHKQ